MEQICESQKIKKVRISWKSENVVKTFLEACIDEVSEFGRKGASLKAFSWKNVAEKLKRNHNFVVDQKQMKNHYDYLKGKYTAWSKLKNKAGNAYDPVTNTFNLSEEEWIIEMKGNKYIESLKSTSLLFPKLCTQLFEEVAIKRVEDGGSSSTRSRSCAEAEPICIEENEDLNETQETSTPNCSSHAKDERPTKKTKALKSPNMLTIEEDVSKAIKLIIDRNNGPSFKDCQDKLRSLGWGAKNPLHKMALVIFCESATYREAWLHLQADEVEDWVRMIGHKLGLVT
ncbi:hypothetical protein OSB04_013702 [Centaurea solstitialis]|uniref:Myb/SANT-like domain-containing protein n=1 Tax=Centaurea solstitialis TaxID=347529 RepID=A0AA38TYI0_9ASTR|nr:hypothetical protein OSB04_013702 [Centaurea solstitialis]